MHTRLILILLALLAMAFPAAATPAHLRVVELFTSQGCSSCPPADAYLLDLSEHADVLPLSFHVDYWDSLGWRDRFATASGTERQRRYAQTLQAGSSIYTPQAVLDGQVQFVGSDRRAIGAALSQRPAVISAPIEVSIMREAAHFVVKVGTSPQRGADEVVWVSFLRRAVTPVGRGENGGRTLTEANIVRSLGSLGIWNGTARTFEVAADSLPADATDVAVLLQEKNQGSIVAAATVAVRAPGP